MFCPNCIKLARKDIKKVCIRCQGVILNSISCICDICSNDNRVCSVCLKKISVSSTGINKFHFGARCKACGGG